MIRLKPFLGHFLFWAIHSTYIYFTVYLQFPQVDGLDLFLLRFLVIVSFYINVLFVLDLFTKNIYLGILAFIGNFIFYGLLKYLERFIFLPAIGHMRFYEPFELRSFLINVIFNFIEFTLYAIGYWYAKRSIKTQKELRLASEKVFISERTNLELTNQKIILENNYLKAQINPHFLYNTLHFLYNKTEAQNKQAAKCAYLLTEIMRYALENESQDGMIMLEDEVTHLENYIELHQLRFENTLHIKLEKKGKFSGIRIPHYSLITFIENAFKHGIVNDVDYPLYISLKVNQSKLIFEVKNKKDNALKVNKLSSGVGLKNIQERMRMVYADKQTITILETENDFNLKMEVQIN